MPLFDIISVVLCEAEGERQPDPNIFFMYPASAADAAAINPLFANGVITFFY